MIKKTNNLILIVLSFCIIAGCASIKTKSEVAGDYFNLGNEYYSMKNYKKAIEEFEKSLEYNKSFQDAKINLIISYQLDGQYDKSEKLIIDNYKALNTDFNKKLLLLLGNNYFYKQNYDKAVKTFNLYIESTPGKPEGYFNLGLTYQKLNDNDNTIKYFLLAYNADGKFIPVVSNLASYYYDRKKYDDSLVYYRILVELDKANPDVYYKLGLLEMQKEEYEISRDSFNKAIELDQKNPEYYLSLAKVYAKAFNNKAKTISYIEKALILGYKDFNSLKAQPEFLILNEYADFKDLIRRYSGTP
jgi:tetratricopeptide (TPR) repeat protein